MNDPQLKLDFVTDLKAELARALQKAGYTIVEADLIVDDVVRRYLNVLRRRILPRPRTVRRSAEFSCPASFQQGLALLEQKAATGADLSPHQSKSLGVAEFNDAILNDWDVQHFHLGAAPDPNAPGFVERTGPVLFARVTQTNFDLIDVRAHGRWHQQDLVEIVHRNWPDSLQAHRAHGLSAEPLPNETIKTFRRKHVNYVLTMQDGTMYFPPGGGSVASGMNLRLVVAADYMLVRAREAEQLVRASFDQFCAQAASEGFTINRPAHIHLRVRDDRWFAEDRASGFALELVETPPAAPTV